MQHPSSHYGGKPQHVSLYCPNYTCMITVPRSTISHMPAQRLNITRLVACKNFSDAVALSGQAHPADACKMGSRCKFVHVSRPLSDFPTQALHAHYIWRSVNDVTYDRLWTEKDGSGSEDSLLDELVVVDTPTLRITHNEECRDQLLQYRQQPQEEASNTVVHVLGGDVDLHERTEPGVSVMVDVIAAVMPSVRIPATRLLKTEGAIECLRRTQAGQPVPDLTICAQYSCENECRHGSKCRDAHVINIDGSLQVPFVRRSIRNVKDAAVAIEIVAHIEMPIKRYSPTSYSHNPYFRASTTKTVECIC